DPHRQLQPVGKEWSEPIFPRRSGGRPPGAWSRLGWGVQGGAELHPGVIERLAQEGVTEAVRGQVDTEGCPSGQREQTVNLPAHAFEGSNPSPSTIRKPRGNSSAGRASAFQAECHGFESRF